MTRTLCFNSYKTSDGNEYGLVRLLRDHADRCFSVAPARPVRLLVALLCCDRLVTHPALHLSTFSILNLLNVNDPGHSWES